MLVAKDQRVGIDEAIYQMQVILNEKFARYIGIDPDDEKFKCYGRAYRNPNRSTGDVSGPSKQEAHVYIGKNEYKRVPVDDRLSALCFFGMGDKVDIAEDAQTDIHLVFFVNLEKCFPGSTVRKDEEIRLKVIEILKAGTTGSDITSIETTPLKVMREYNAEYESRADWHPFHLFRVNMRVSYDKRPQVCNTILRGSNN